MKKILVLLILFASAMTVWPSPVTSGKAKQWALNFFRDKSQTRGGFVSLDMVWDGEDNVSRTNTAPSFYVFNRTDTKGFVVVAGDDAVNPLIGYSFENNFNYTNLPANIRVWFEDVKREMKAIRNSSGYQKAAEAWQTEAPVGTDVIKRETALWNQGDPYNLKCPDDVFNKRSVTGCTATAMAIVMRGYEWPTYGKGVLPSYKYILNSQEITIKERSVEREYKWKDMPLTVDTNTTPEQKIEIANLMMDCGQMAGSVFTSQSTGGNPNNALKFLQANFSYSPDMKTVNANNYTHEEWISLLKKELESGQILYGGRTTNDEGHAFVLHGYTSTDYFAVNWGWGGSNNGYFKLSHLGTKNQGTGGSTTDLEFNYYQDAVVNFKNTIVSLPELSIHGEKNTWGIRTATEIIKENESVIHVEKDLKVHNPSPQTYKSKIAYCLFDSNHKQKAVLGYEHSLDLQQNYIVTLSGGEDLTIPSTAKVGDYIAMGEQKKESTEFVPIKGGLNTVSKLVIGGFDHALTNDIVALAVGAQYKETPYGLHTSIDKIEKNVNFTLTADQVKNITAGPVTCKIGVGVYSKDHTFKSLISEKQTDMNNDQQNPMLSNLTFNCCISNDIIPGDYISLCYSTDNGSTWKRVRALDNIKAHITLLETSDVLANTTIEYNKTDGMITVENVLADEYYELKNAQGVTVQKGLGDKAFVIDTKKFAAARYVLWIYLSKGAKEHIELELTFGQK